MSVKQIKCHTNWRVCLTDAQISVICKCYVRSLGLFLFSIPTHSEGNRLLVDCAVLLVIPDDILIFD